MHFAAIPVKVTKTSDMKGSHSNGSDGSLDSSGKPSTDSNFPYAGSYSGSSAFPPTYTTPTTYQYSAGAGGGPSSSQYYPAGGGNSTRPYYASSDW